MIPVTKIGVCAACLLLFSGCAGLDVFQADRDSKAVKQSETGPKLVAAQPQESEQISLGDAGELRLTFDDVIDTGAQLAVTLGRSDVIAGEPELSSDRRYLSTRFDMEMEGTYKVTYRVCSARKKTECSGGEYTFTAVAPPVSARS